MTRLGTPTLCLNLDGNNVIDNGAGSGEYRLRQDDGTFNVENLATVEARNQGTFTFLGTIGNALNCL